MNAHATLKAFQAEDRDLAAIGRFTRRAFSPEELYTFSVILCDNEVDRDCERFTVKALEELARLFVGKTGIFDHNPSAGNQTARIYRAEVSDEPGRVTSAGEGYACVKARAYMIRGGGNADLIAEIDGGIKKEVSVGCSVGEIRCSICGADIRAGGCEHQKGVRYGGELCHYVLDAPTDAYEWSFVAVPAQVGAGVTKSYQTGAKKEVKPMRGFEELMKAFSQPGEKAGLSREEAARFAEEVERLQREAALGRAYRADLQKEVKRLAFLAEEQLRPEILDSVVDKLELDELKAFQKAYESRIDKGAFQGQLNGARPVLPGGASAFKL